MDIERKRRNTKKRYNKWDGRVYYQVWNPDTYRLEDVTDGWDVRLMVLIFDAVCAMTKQVTFRNAYLTCKILRSYK